MRDKPTRAPALGDPYRFVPAAFASEASGVLPGNKPVVRTVTGKVEFINYAHRFFTVAFEVCGYIFRESFKF